MREVDMKPKSFKTAEHARRWAALGGIGLATNPHYALYGPAKISEPAGWFRHWLAKAGRVFIEVEGRGQTVEGHKLAREEWERLEGYANKSDQSGTTPFNLTTVVFVTGTRNGMTVPQADAIRERLVYPNVCELHHGCCVGADDEVNEMVSGLRSHAAECEQRRIVIYGYPASVSKELQARSIGNCNIVADECEPLARNVNMAERAAVLNAEYVRGARVRPVMLACPKEETRPEHNRGGAWHAIRHFVNRGVRTVIVYPSGRTECFDP